MGRYLIGEGLEDFVDEFELNIGEGRTRVTLQAFHLGADLLVWIHNENAHLGAVAVGEYDVKEERASCSVLTRLGHKDDFVAREAAHTISKRTKRPVCVVAGIHLNKITAIEIDDILKNSRSLIIQLCTLLEQG